MYRTGTIDGVRLNLAICAVVLLGGGCSSGPNSVDGLGSRSGAGVPAGACAEVVDVDSSTQAQAVQFVFDYIRKNFPGGKIKNKLLRGEESDTEKRLFDVYELSLADGRSTVVCFDISATIAGFGRTNTQ